ncbi:MAG: hypothetical protein FJZ47_20370, partial [Candidatus Tectomicrobia bacterium]|nr:hypothetical protein [Candidatus Tectomicrobia bacterium]
MNVLLIGGTRFQGRYLVNELLNTGHTVTVFHRGGHTIGPRCGLVDLIGDRNVPADLAQLAGYQFDACIDTCAYFPIQVSLVSDVLNTRHYCLISSVYVYADRDALLREDDPLHHIPGGPGPGLTPDNYGALKALCEEEAVVRFGNGSLILRPSVIIGVGDHTERLQFWMRLVAVHRKRLDIAGWDPVVQLVDVRDLAHFTTRCIETARQGTVNVCGEPVRLSVLLDSIAAISGHTCERKSVHIEDLPKLGLERLPYCESGHLARHDTALSRTWGYVGRDWRDSLTEIHHHFQCQGFAMQNL